LLGNESVVILVSVMPITLKSKSSLSTSMFRLALAEN